MNSEQDAYELPEQPFSDSGHADDEPRRRVRLPAWLTSRENAARAVFLLGALVTLT
jgi:hypothetical protein